MKEIKEKHITCRFPKEWSASMKFDALPFYRDVSNGIQSTKAVDIVALGDPKLFLIELKDYRGFAIANKAKLRTGELIQHVAAKVRDTLAVLYAAHRQGLEEMAPVCRHLFDPGQRPIQVVLVLEQDGDRKGRYKRDGIALSELDQKLKSALKPLGVQLRVCDCAASRGGGWEARAEGCPPQTPTP